MIRFYSFIVKITLSYPNNAKNEIFMKKLKKELKLKNKKIKKFEFLKKSKNDES